MTSILILGHSYIARLRDEVGQGTVENFLQTSNHTNISAYGIRGANASGDYTSRFLNMINFYEPQVVVVELGINDILDGTPALTVANNLIKMCATFLEKATFLQHVFLNSLIQPCNLPDFVATNAGKCNEILYHMAYTEPLITFYKHRPTIFKTTDFSDRLHPIMSQHMVYWKSLRRLIFTTVQRYKQVIVPHLSYNLSVD